MLTTSKAEEDIFRTYDLGVNSFITKPVTFDGLVEVMQTLARYWFEIVELPGDGADDDSADAPSAPARGGRRGRLRPHAQHAARRRPAAGFELDWAPSFEVGLRAIERGPARRLPDRLPARRAHRPGADPRGRAPAQPPAPVILLTGQGDYEVDLEATALGVTDYLVKGDARRAAARALDPLRAAPPRSARRAAPQRGALRARGSRANDGIWDWDLATATRLLLARAGSRMLGYDEVAVGDRPEAWLDRVHPDDVESGSRARSTPTSPARTPHFEIEHRMRHADGS